MKELLELWRSPKIVAHLIVGIAAWASSFLICNLFPATLFTLIDSAKRVKRTQIMMASLWWRMPINPCLTNFAVGVLIECFFPMKISLSQFSLLLSLLVSGRKTLELMIRLLSNSTCVGDPSVTTITHAVTVVSIHAFCFM